MKSAPPSTNSPVQEVIIPKENAVFWMDGQGRWFNRHGRFEHKRIIDHFNRSIRRDEDGYYVTQIRDDIREKVYFKYEDTPLFVVRIIGQEPIRLLLNTGNIISLDPAGLYVAADQLYQLQNDEHIKFSERALVAMTTYLEDGTDGLILRIGDHTWPVPDRSPHP